MDVSWVGNQQGIELGLHQQPRLRQPTLAVCYHNGITVSYPFGGTKIEMESFASIVPTKYWHRLEDSRIQCDLCPRYCKLHEGQRGFCFVRACQGGAVVLTTYGRSSGFCVDPIEKKPLYHFLPGTPVLSFGTAGCNLGCKFCLPPDTLIATTTGIRRIVDLFDAC